MLVRSSEVLVFVALQSILNEHLERRHYIEIFARRELSARWQSLLEKIRFIVYLYLISYYLNSLMRKLLGL